MGMTILNILKVVPFIVLGLAVLFGGLFFMDKSAIKFLGIDNPTLQAAFLIVPVILCLSFIFASAAAHLKEAIWIKIIYTFSAVCIGLLMNLLLAVSLIWLIKGLSMLAGYDLNLLLFSTVIFSLAIIFSAWGYWNATHPRVKNIEVAIKNLPPQWRNKTVVQISDIHLGLINRLSFFNRVVQQINVLKPEMVFITGDLFDGTDGDLNAFVKPLNDIQAPKGVFYITGNHESYLGLDRIFSILAKTNIRVLNDESVDADGLEIVGLAYSPAGHSSDITGRSKNIAEAIASLNNYDPEKPNILLYHSPVNTDQAKASGINLQLSGHTHKGQIFPFQFITRIVYGPYHSGLHVDGDYTIYASNGVGTWGPPMKTNARPEIVAIKLA